MEKNILLVDDHEDSRKILAIILKRAGYNVIPAGNGKDALEEIGKTTFQVAIIDYKLPDINGMEIVMKVKEVNPQTLVILASGLVGLEETLDETAKRNIDKFLIKPIDAGKLKDYLKEVLKPDD